MNWAAARWASCCSATRHSAVAKCRCAVIHNTGCPVKSAPKSCGHAVRYSAAMAWVCWSLKCFCLNCGVPPRHAPDLHRSRLVKGAPCMEPCSMYTRLLQSLNHIHPRAWDFIQLMRLERPIGIYLLLWPTLWALWIAAKGVPSLGNLVIFVLGVVLMRSAGCVINDYADRNFDGHVARTKGRPLATGKVTPKEALILFAVLVGLSFIL